MSEKQRSLNELAGLLAMPEGLALVRKLQELGEIEERNPTASSGEPERGSDLAFRGISIWKPKQESSGWIFERPEVGPFGDHYSKRMRFGAAKKKGTFRIAFFGESVAAGYLYAPYLTPAMVLESQLERAFPDAEFEILDFSRTNESLVTLTQTAKDAAQVDPDLMIFFAGNNFPLLEITEWTPYFPSVSARQALGRQWHMGGLMAVKAEEQRILSRKVGTALDGLANWCNAQNLPAIWMIPEVNLLDWDHVQPPPWLPGEGLRRWYAILGEAESAFACGKFQDAAALAWALLDLDGGSSPVGYRILGLVHAEFGALALAREAFRYEVQAAGYAGSCFLGAPQVTTQMRALIEKVWCGNGLEVIDIAAVFQKKRPDHLPDRYYFLDYCHLTKEGMATAMGSLLASVSGYLGLGLHVPGSDEHLPEVAAEVDSLAFLGAAIHSCHRQFPAFPNRTPWRHWIEKALEVGSCAVQKVFDYAALRVRPAPPVFNEIQARNAASKAPFTPQHGWFYDHVDAPMLSMIFEILTAREPDRGSELMDALIDGLFEFSRPVDLMDPPFFLWEPLARFMPDVMPGNALPKPAFLQCPWPKTKFAVISDGMTALKITAVIRLPEVAWKGKKAVVTWLAGGRALQKTEAGARWSTHVIQLSHLERGLNCLTIQWPIPNAAIPEDIAHNLALGREGRFHPCFGEIFSLVLEKN